MDQKSEKKLLEQRRALVLENDKWLRNRKESNPEMIEYLEISRKMSDLFKKADKAHSKMIAAVKKAQPLYEKMSIADKELRDIRSQLDRARELLSQSDKAISYWQRRLDEGFGDLGPGFNDLLWQKSKVEGGEFFIRKNDGKKSKKQGRNERVKRPFGDLTGVDRENLEMIKERKAILNSLQNRLHDLRSERKEQVQIVKMLRSAISGVEASDSGRKKLLNQFHDQRKKSQGYRKLRDTINKRIPPPSSILQDWLKETYESLTLVANDLTAVQMLNPELSAFSRFFEIQASILIKREAEKSHEKYILSLGEIKKISAKLDENKDVANKTVSEIKENIEIEEDKISRKEIRKISKGITSIDEEIDLTNIEIKVKERS